MRLVIKRKVLVGLSGGVDSSVAVHILREQGYNVAGCVMKMSDCHEETVDAARKTAKALGVELFELDLRDEFHKNVIEYFVNEYKSGRTPNPCIICNPTVKFRQLLKCADDNGFDYIATGHYATIEEKNGVYYLKRGKSLERDQSYMLYRLEQNVLSRLILPLAEIEKPLVRELASKLGLECANAPDSQEICFVSDNDYAGYIERNFGGASKGEFIAPNGTVCGEHKGIIHYTVGQRKGLGIALGRPVFISRISPDDNRIYLAFEVPPVSEVRVHNITETFEGAIADGITAFAKLRSVAKPFECVVKRDGEELLLLAKEPQKKVSSGQGAVLYNGDTVLGGGIIL